MKILFPTDFSNAADNAFVYALKLAERLQASIQVIHVYEVLEVHSWIEESMDMTQLNEKITLGEFEKYKEQIELLKRIAVENQLGEIDINYTMKESSEIVQAIVDEANASQADMIVIGTTGAHGIKELFFGTIASKVMEHAKCPVLVVPDTATYRGIQKMALTLQYKHGELDLIEKAITMAHQFHAQLHCLHVDVYDPEKIKHRKEEYEQAFAHDPGVSFHTHYDLDTEKGILDYMKAQNMDVIIMRMEHQSLLKEIFSQSLAKRIAYHSEIPLITLH
ncbi:MAG TPA: universal stress protein [Saprospiraceae bacterium]|nr:universal stress protein [Saprospiraceae bacterium]